MITAPDWSGSAGQRKRKPRGGCRPPKQPQGKYYIACGTQARVRRVAGGEWQFYETTKNLEFDSYHMFEPAALTFRRADWLLRVNKSDIEFRRNETASEDHE